MCFITRTKQVEMIIWVNDVIPYVYLICLSYICDDHK